MLEVDEVDEKLDRSLSKTASAEEAPVSPDGGEYGSRGGLRRSSLMVLEGLIAEGKSYCLEPCCLC